ncbi:hypothetical protein MKX03_002030 [Papaver bracteatum]|nr:hypothetical protein MKX03_002030 [Papaver bracteatum]
MVKALLTSALVLICLHALPFLQDWLDIDFGVAERVDFTAISSVKSAEVSDHLKSYITGRSGDSDIAIQSISEEICNSAAKMGHMSSLLSHSRSDCPIFAFTNIASVRRRLNLQWGLIPFWQDFSVRHLTWEQPEQNLLFTQGKRND